MDNYMSETEYKAELEKIKTKNESIKRKQLLQKQREKGKPKKRKMLTSKKAMWLIAIIMIQIIIFSEIAMILLHDAVAMPVLIGIASVAMGYIYRKYIDHSNIENSKDGIVYETAMWNLNNQAVTTAPTFMTPTTTPTVTMIETEDEQDNQEDNGL